MNGEGLQAFAVFDSPIPALIMGLAYLHKFHYTASRHLEPRHFIRNKE
jgi:hypothetical protein